ncbi:CDP-alcohol phosphatidyltransferase family protein [Alicyclobacillaceae bacterium I2511]|nr:CDP-alcohol phosphatidyltransferase family protein [Alicyclobacillaceae bacterium I2511]
MNLPNTLTLFRLVLIPVYLEAFYGTASPHKVLALLIVLVAGATDVADGYIARHRHAQTPVGQLLDPLADKLMMVAVLFSLLEASRVSWLAAGLLVFRDVAMILGATFFYFQGKRAVPKANRWGKTTTVFYYLSICSIILAWPDQSFSISLLWFTVVLSYVTTLLYVVRMKLMDIKHRLL